MEIAKIVPPPLQSLNQNERVWSQWFINMFKNTNAVTGGVNDLINIPTITVDSDTKTLLIAGVSVELIAATAITKVILPKITDDIVGKEIKVTLTDHTFDGIIESNSSDTINDEANVGLNIAGMSITVFAQALGEWWII